ncbi:MAG: PD-(D/E)XK nuclease family protein [Campylobacterota bacterium]|nr:PD-(D/E)XK nuclease family protein [Campylobacterota bacterium]
MGLLNKILNIFNLNNSVINYSPYSFSKIDIWERCPYRFKLKYIDKVKTSFEPNLALLKGSFLHHCIEYSTEGKEYQTNEVFTEEEKKKAIEILTKFTKSELYKLYLSANGKHEVKFGILKENNIYKADSFDNINSIFKGKIDYVFQRDDELYIVDWKSGKYTEENEQKFDQLLLYAIWGFLKYPKIDTINCSFVYMEHLKENMNSFHRKDLKHYIQTYIQYINKIESDQLFEKIESDQCEYCEYKKFDYCNEKVKIREDIEVDLNTLNEKQLFNLMKLGEIDAITYYGYSQELKNK